MGWDVATVYTTAEELALGLTPTQLEYFQGCPNNAPLTFLHFIPLWAAGKIGLAVPPERFVQDPENSPVLETFWLDEQEKLVPTNRDWLHE